MNAVRILAALLVMKGTLAIAAEPVERPNFVVILCDDLGYGDLGCFGHPHIKTPHLDELAAEGIRLTNCYSSPVCSSSRAGLMAGKTPNRLGVYDWIPNGHVVHLRKSDRTVATLLNESGYATAHVGKWHLNGKFNSSSQPQPGDHGFDHWYSTQNNASPTHRNPSNFVRNGKTVGPTEGFSCQLVADEAIRWLGEQSADQPFFMFVCFHEPHEPVASPKELTDSYAGVAEKREQAEYFANVSNMDRAVGRIVKALDQSGLSDETLVFFTSDNGPETLNRYRGAARSYGSPGKMRGMKLWMYDGGIRVPGIIRWKGRVGSGRVVDEPVCGLDVFPTLCELAGVQIPFASSLDGASFVPLLSGEPITRPRPLYWHYYRALGEPKVALRDGRWMILGHRAPDPTPLGSNVNPRSMRVIQHETLSRFELYDMIEDPSQSTDLAKSNPKVLKRLRSQLLERHALVKQESPVWKFEGNER